MFRLFQRFQRSPQMPTRYLIVGLGNPGPEYEQTRHNVGFRVIDCLAERHGISVRKLEKRALIGSGQVAGEPVLLAKPMTYMNLSGESVAPLMRYANLQPQNVIVIYDDLDLPVGRLRIRREGSPGGHNGIKSLAHFLKTQEFPRVRIGIGRPQPGRDIKNYVLTKFSREEAERIDDAIEKAADAVETIIREGVELAMTRFNAG